MSLDEEARAELRELETAHWLRVPRVLDGAQGPVVTLDGVEVLNFASNDYLGLAGDRRLVAAACRALEAEGVGAGASRLVVGNHRRHVSLEGAVADWLQVEGVRLFNTGYAANVGVLTALLRAGDVVFSDELNHASIIDGCRLSKADIVVFGHRDMAQLETELGRRSGRRRIVVSESLFSMDGDFADVVALDGLCRRHDAALILDEAHAIGAIGEEGRGLAAMAGVTPSVMIGTFGKSLGSFGAFAATTRAISDLLWNRARPLVFSTGMPPSVAAASHVAVEVVRGSEGARRRTTLARHARRFRELVACAGGANESPIVPIVIGDDWRVMKISARLFEARIFAQGIRPPTVAVGTARLRVSVSAAHDVQHVETAALSLNNAMRQDS